MKKLVSILMCLVMLFCLAACTPKPQEQSNPQPGNTDSQPSGSAQREFTRLTLGTSSLGGTYYTLGGGWANIMNRVVDNIEISVEQTGGPSSNLELMEQGEMEIAFVTTWVSGDGWDGNPNSWAAGTKYKEQRAIFPMYSSIAHFFSLEGSGINSIQDFNGKNMTIGNPGATGNLVGNAVIEVFGLKPKTVNAVSTEVAMNNLKDRTSDCGVNVTGAPGPAFLNAETTHDIHYIPFSSEEMAQLLKAYPYWSEGAIPAGTYKNQNEDVRAIALWNACVVDKDLDADLVYELVKATFENIEELYAVDATAKQFDAKMVNNCGIPLHPGAARYYEEIGIKLADNVKPID